jgi:hypothetical protein
MVSHFEMLIIIINNNNNNIIVIHHRHLQCYHHHPHRPPPPPPPRAKAKALLSFKPSDAAKPEGAKLLVDYAENKRADLSWEKDGVVRETQLIKAGLLVSPRANLLPHRSSSISSNDSISSVSCLMLVDHDQYNQDTPVCVYAGVQPRGAPGGPGGAAVALQPRPQGLPQAQGLQVRLGALVMTVMMMMMMMWRRGRVW